MAEEMVPAKKPWESKTNWVALVTAVAVFLPPVQAWVSAHPEAFGLVVSGVFAFLRQISAGKISIS